MRYAAAPFPEEPPVPSKPARSCLCRRSASGGASATSSAGSFRIFDVRRVELEDGAGRDRGHAFTIRANDWCNVIAVTPSDEIVFVWQYRFGTRRAVAGDPRRRDRRRRGARSTPRSASSSRRPATRRRASSRSSSSSRTRRSRTTAATRSSPSAPAPPRRPGSTRWRSSRRRCSPPSRLAELLDSGQVTHSLVQGALEAFWRRYRA